MLKINYINSDRLYFKVSYPSFLLAPIIFLFIIFLFHTFIPFNIGFSCNKTENKCYAKQQFLFRKKQDIFNQENIKNAYIYKAGRSTKIGLNLKNSKNYMYGQIELKTTKKMVNQINTYLNSSSKNNLNLRYRNDFLVLMIIFMSIPALIFIMLFLLSSAEVLFCNETKSLKLNYNFFKFRKVFGYEKGEIPFSDIEKFELKETGKPSAELILIKLKSEKIKKFLVITPEHYYLLEKMNEFIK